MVRGRTLTHSLLLALAGCSASAPPVQQFLLEPGPPVPAAVCEAGSSHFTLGNVALPAYLLRSHIMLATGDGRLTPAYQHRWAEPLGAGVRRILDQLAGAEAPSAVRLDVDISRFHGAVDGTVLLDASWAVRPEGQAEPLASGRFLRTRPQPAPGYPALVRTHTALLSELAGEIRSALCSARNQSAGTTRISRPGSESVSR